MMIIQCIILLSLNIHKYICHVLEFTMTSESFVFKLIVSSLRTKDRSSCLFVLPVTYYVHDTKLRFEEYLLNGSLDPGSSKLGSFKPRSVSNHLP